MSRGYWEMLTSVPVRGLSLPQSWATTHFLRPHALLLALSSGHTPCRVFLSASLFRSRDSWLLPPPEEEEAGIESEAPSPRLTCLRKMRAVLRSWKKPPGPEPRDGGGRAGVTDRSAPGPVYSLVAWAGDRTWPWVSENHSTEQFVLRNDGRR